ncbi:MAG: hypothetical protein WB789_10420 [Thermoplasmata archaeon]
MANKDRYTADQIENAYTLLKAATKAKPITSEELGHKLGLDDIEGNWKARALIGEVVRQRNLPVGAKGRGYYVLKTVEDLKEYREDLARRIHGIFDRIRSVEDAFETTYGKQPPGGQASLEDEW